MAAQETLGPVAVIGAGLDLGAGRRGVDMGPSAIRYAGLQERIEGLGRVCVDWGDVVVARERDQAEARVILAQACDRCDAVEQRHVEIDHRRVGVVLVCGLDRLDPVARDCDHVELGLPVDKLPQ